MEESIQEQQPVVLEPTQLDSQQFNNTSINPQSQLITTTATQHERSYGDSYADKLFKRSVRTEVEVEVREGEGSDSTSLIQVNQVVTSVEVEQGNETTIVEDSTSYESRIEEVSELISQDIEMGDLGETQFIRSTTEERGELPAVEPESKEPDHLLPSDEEEEEEEGVQSPIELSLGQLSAELDRQEQRELSLSLSNKGTSTSVTTPVSTVVLPEEEEEVDQLISSGPVSSQPQPLPPLPPPVVVVAPTDQQQSTLLTIPQSSSLSQPVQRTLQGEEREDSFAPSSSPFVAQILLKNKTSPQLGLGLDGEEGKKVFQSLPETFRSSSADPDLSGRTFGRIEQEGGERIEKRIVPEEDEDEDDDEDDDYTGDQSGDTLLGPITSTQLNSNPQLPAPLPTQPQPQVSSIQSGSGAGESANNNVGSTGQSSESTNIHIPSPQLYSYLPSDEDDSSSNQRRQTTGSMGGSNSNSLPSLRLRAKGFNQSSAVMDLVEEKEKEKKKKKVDPMDVDFSEEEREEEEEKEAEEEAEKEKEEREGGGGGDTQVDEEENGEKDMTLDESISIDQTKEEEEEEESRDDDDTPRPTGEMTKSMDIDNGDDDDDEDFPLPLPTHSSSPPPIEVEESSPPPIEVEEKSQTSNASNHEDYQETPTFGPSGDTQVESQSQSQPQSQMTSMMGGQTRKNGENFFRLSDINNLPNSSLEELELESEFIDIPATQVDYDIQLFNSNESRSNKTSSRKLPAFTYNTSLENSRGEGSSTSLPPPAGRELRRKPPPPASSDAPLPFPPSSSSKERERNTFSSPGGSVNSSSSRPNRPQQGSRIGLGHPSSSSSIIRSSPQIFEGVVIITSNKKNRPSFPNTSTSGRLVSSSPVHRSQSPSSQSHSLGSQQRKVKNLPIPLAFPSTISSNGIVPDSESSILMNRANEKGKGKEKAREGEEEVEEGEGERGSGETIINESRGMDIDEIEVEKEVVEEELKVPEKKKPGRRPKRGTVAASTTTTTTSAGNKAKGKGKGKAIHPVSGSPDELDLISAGTRGRRSSTPKVIMEEVKGNAQEEEAEETFEETNYDELPLPTNATKRVSRRSVTSTTSKISPLPQSRTTKATSKRKNDTPDISVEIPVSKRRRSGPSPPPPTAPAVEPKKMVKGKGKKSNAPPVNKKKGRTAPTRKATETPPPPSIEQESDLPPVAGPSRIRFNSVDDVQMADGTRGTEPSYEGTGIRRPKSRLPASAPFTRIFGQWRDDGWWYPGTILGTTTGGGSLKILFDDESKATLSWEEIRKCELKRGDYFKYRGDEIETETQAELFNGELRVFRVEEGLTGEDRVGELGSEDIVVATKMDVPIEQQQEVGQKERIVSAAVCIPASRTAQLNDRKLTEEEVAGIKGVADKVEPSQKLSLLPIPLELIDPPVVINKKRGLFHGIGFLFTKAPPLVIAGKKGAKVPTQDEVLAEKSTYTKLLQSEGGTVIEIPHLFSIETEKESREVSLEFELESLKGLDKILLLADRPSTTTKFLVALALGIPCVSMEFVAMSIKEKSLLDWKAFLITTGYLPLLKTYAVGGIVKALSKNSFDLASIESAYLKDGLFHGSSFLVIVPRKGKTPAQLSNQLIVFRNILSAGGATRVDFVENPEAAKSALDYTYVIIDDSSKSTTSLARHEGVVNVEWMKQSLISGRLLSAERLEGAQADH